MWSPLTMPTPPILLSWIRKKSLEPLWVIYRMHETGSRSHGIWLFYRKMLGILNNWFGNDWLAFMRQDSCRKWTLRSPGLFAVIPHIYVCMYTLTGGYDDSYLLALLLPTYSLERNYLIFSSYFSVFFIFLKLCDSYWKLLCYFFVNRQVITK